MNETFVARYCANVISQIQSVGFDQSYSTVSHSDSFRIIIAIMDTNRITERACDVNDDLRNTNVPIHEKVSVGPPPYYLGWFKNLTPMFFSIHMTIHFVFNA